MSSNSFSGTALGLSVVVLVGVGLGALALTGGEPGLSGRVTGEDPVAAVESDFDDRVVSRVVRKRLPAIRACYERHLRADPYLGGKVTVELTIEAGGGVSTIRTAQNTTRHGGVAECIVRTIGRLSFAPGPSSGSVTYSYPFVFQSDIP